MSRTEIWRDAARTATEQQRQRIKSTAEAQQELAEQIELIAESLKLLSDENRETLRALRNQFQSTTELARHRIEQATEGARHVGNWLDRMRVDVEQATENVQALAWEIRLLWMVVGLLTGLLSLTGLAIWQPKLLQEALQAAWQAAVTLGTVPAQ